MSALCRFDSPDFTRTLSGGGIPTFAVDPSNSNFLHAAGSFTNGYGSVCSFPTQYQLQKNTITPYLVLPGSTTTICTGGYRNIYTEFCGTYWTSVFSHVFRHCVTNLGNGLCLQFYHFNNYISCNTYRNYYDYTTTGTIVVTQTLPAQPSSTEVDYAYSTTVISTDYSTPPPLSTKTTTKYTSTVFSTFLLTATPSSTTTFTEYSSTSIDTEYSTSTISNTATLTQSVQSCYSSDSWSISSSFSSSLSSVTSSSTGSAPTSSSYICPDADGLIYTANSGKRFQVECYADHQVGQLAVDYTESFKACMQVCDSTSGCESLAYTGGFSSGYCYLKSEIGAISSASNVWGAKTILDTSSSVAPSSA
ncbi:hypothetical protein AOQ84DRAFT_383668 [Glonium stellatum]|uniref:Apple domain-containing protein n=1 Tax=Glonium stellatum TaxID=574774 RepID=A0A8E2EMZ3_9PEZI|nr:hypothetical protein AOQ84DRAFT_383668 [Glonium stellatum]